MYQDTPAYANNADFHDWVWENFSDNEIAELGWTKLKRLYDEAE